MMLLGPLAARKALAQRRYAKDNLLKTMLYVRTTASQQRIHTRSDRRRDPALRAHTRANPPRSPMRQSPVLYLHATHAKHERLPSAARNAYRDAQTHDRDSRAARAKHA